MDGADVFLKLKKIYADKSAIGNTATYLPGVEFFWESEPQTKTPMLCPPGIVFLGQGQKIGHLDGKSFYYDKDHYLICSLPTAFECEALVDILSPLFGIFIEFDATRLNRLIDKIEKHQGEFSFRKFDIYRSIEPIALDISMRASLHNLLQCLQNPMDCDALGEALIDEVFYRALLGPHGKALVALTRQETGHARVSKSLTHIHENFKGPLTVEDLAQQANMSTSSFYRAFKHVTGESPLQYIKKTRLNNAQRLIVNQGVRVNVAATEVGYESVSQFSREFKRHFNITPRAARTGNLATIF